MPDGEHYASAIPMVGKKYGHLTVIANAGRRDYGRPSYARGHRLRIRLVRVVCDCGAEYDAVAFQVRQGVNRCTACAREDNARRQRDETSVRLSNGKTIAQIAASSGLALGTVYRRFLRGWPVERLGVPLRTARQCKGYGGSVDLPERRRTVYPGSAR